MSRGIFEVTPELLADLLHLPEGSRLIPGDCERNFKFVVDHLDIRQDAAVHPTYQRTRDGVVRFVSWGQE